MKGNKSPFANWLSSANRHVAYFNLFGFDDLLDSNLSNQVGLYERLNDFFDAIQLVENFIGVETGMSDVGHVSGALRCLRLLDKVILVTKDDSKQSLFALDMAAMVVVSHAIFNGFLVRGAIASGEVIVNFDHNVCVGKAVAEASALERTQQWFNITYHSSSSIEQTTNEEDIREATDQDVPLSTYYPVPLIDDGDLIYEEMQVLNWPIFGKNASEVKRALRDTEYPIHLNLNSFIERTEGFIEHSFKERNKL